ncbi:hypothetical protein DFH28DRAFT_1156956 [Melampsora americana]|nr:hypothetical protein DFH28DRAFT_1156956 [Melampsora americana]
MNSEQSYIKFDHQIEYDHFINKLTTQVKSYTEEACLSNGIRLGSSDAKAIEEVIFDVFLKHTIELMRPNLSISGSPIPIPIDFKPTSKDSKKPESSKSSQLSITVANQTKPIDAALTERVVRQQYAVNEAAVDNSRKRKALPTHLMNLVKNGIDEHQTELKERCDKERESHEKWVHASDEIEPKHRWKVINDKLTNVEQAQEDYTVTGVMLSKLLTSLPSIVDKTERALELEETYIESFGSIG